VRRGTSTRGAAKRGAFTVLPSCLRGTLVVEAGSAWRFPRHSHDAFGIGVILVGAQRSHSGLILSGAAIADAACGAGFADQSHLTRAFAVRYGFSPAAFARALAQ
jgi:AraC-like DNA-binding protein